MAIQQIAARGMVLRFESGRRDEEDAARTLIDQINTAIADLPGEPRLAPDDEDFLVEIEELDEED